MTDRQNDDPAKSGSRFGRKVGAQAARKLKARRSTGGVWFGLGMMGLIGWTVVVPTLLGTALGLWLDEHHPARHSWTLTLLIVGLAGGCLQAWQWVAKEDQVMHEDQGLHEDRPKPDHPSTDDHEGNRHD